MAHQPPNFFQRHVRASLAIFFGSTFELELFADGEARRLSRRSSGEQPRNHANNAKRNSCSDVDCFTPIELIACRSYEK